LFISIHVGALYPFTGKKNVDRSSNVVNIPLKCGDGSKPFQKAVDTQIIPALERFRPELILISAGFDAHQEDPTQAMSLTDEDYFIITEKLKNIANKYAYGRMVSILEGGYNFEALERSSARHLLSLITK